MTMNLLELVNCFVKHTLFKEKNGNHGNWRLGMKHAGRNLISVPFAHYDGADNKTSHDSETYTFILLTPKEYYEKNEKLQEKKRMLKLKSNAHEEMKYPLAPPTYQNKGEKIRKT